MTVDKTLHFSFGHLWFELWKWWNYGRGIFFLTYFTVRPWVSLQPRESLSTFSSLFPWQKWDLSRKEPRASHAWIGMRDSRQTKKAWPPRPSDWTHAHFVLYRFDRHLGEKSECCLCNPQHISAIELSAFDV